MIGVIIKCNFNKWGGRRGLNPRPPESQSGALPTELRPPNLSGFILVDEKVYCKVPTACLCNNLK